jgi:hypothetical protein
MPVILFNRLNSKLPIVVGNQSTFKKLQQPKDLPIIPLLHFGSFSAPKNQICGCDLLWIRIKMIDQNNGHRIMRKWLPIASEVT